MKWAIFSTTLRLFAENRIKKAIPYNNNLQYLQVTATSSDINFRSPWGIFLGNPRCDLPRFCH
jgi:hypothetical protein